MASIPEIGGDINQLAQLFGLNNWELFEASYNGAQFHWMQPSYNGLDPAASLVNYITSALEEGSSQKPNYGTWSSLYSIQDSSFIKSAISHPPGLNGTYVAQSGVSGPTIEAMGIVCGPSYLAVLENCLRYFYDSQLPNSTQGVLSGSNFRQLIHPVFGTINGVCLLGCQVVTRSDEFQAATFRLSFLATDPSYFINASSTNSWQAELGNWLSQAQGGAADINQAFGAAGQIGNGALVSDPIGYAYIPILSNGKSEYFSKVIQMITNRLNAVAESYQNCMAYLTQNSGNNSNSYWNSITVRYDRLPVFLSGNSIFTANDAQAIITFFTNEVNAFVVYADTNDFSYALQKNIFSMNVALSNIVVYVDLVLSQNKTTQTVVLNSPSNIYAVMGNNQEPVANLITTISQNVGSWISSVQIPAGTEVIL